MRGRPPAPSDESLEPAAPVRDAAGDAAPTGPDGEDNRGLPSAGHDDVLGTGCAVEEVPLGQRTLLALDDQGAASREHEERLLCFSRWYIPIRSPDSSTLMLIPKCGNRRLPSNVQ